MIEVVLDRGILRELGEVDPAIRALNIPGYAGASTRKDKVVLLFEEGTSASAISQAQAAFVAARNAINLADPTPSEQTKARTDGAIDRVAALDFNDVKTRIQAITTLAEARTFLLRLAEVVHDLAIIQSSSQQDVDIP